MTDRLDNMLQQQRSAPPEAEMLLLEFVDEFLALLCASDTHIVVVSCTASSNSCFAFEA